MICKGNTHKNGAKLARYMTTPKEGEHVLFGELRGFASDDITKAFRSVHVMAEGTRCEQPFMHVQVRNPDGESLTRDQWQRVADRIEAKLGLTDQPRAIVFHINKETGHEHMHIAWSRIDAETMKAVPLPFFKERLKEVSRELEKELGLTRVTSERDGPVQSANRDEFEEARRLGVDIKQVRQTIRDCWEHSDNGASFRAALADRNLTLAQGDRRDFVVLDHEGGLHALGKRILGVSAAQTRNRLSDINRDELPTIAQAREHIAARKRDAKDRSMPDPDLKEIAWQDALAKAAIEKEKIEGRFIERGQGARAGGKENAITAQPSGLTKSNARTTPRPLRSLRTSIDLPRPIRKQAGRAIGQAFDAVGSVMETVLAPVLTPEQKRDGEREVQRRQADSAERIDLSNTLTRLAQERQRQEQQRQAAPQPHIDERDR
jgi:hypothetical protein